MTGKKKIKLPTTRSQYTSTRAKATKGLLTALPNRSFVRPRIK